MKYCKWLIIILCLGTNFCINGATPNFKIKKNEFEVRVAVVDMQLILANSIAMKSIRRSIDHINNKIQQDLSKKESELKRIEEELIKQQSTLSEEAFKGEVDIFNKKVSVVKEEMRKSKIQLEQIHAKAVGIVHKTTIDIISNLAKKHNVNLVIPSTQIIFAKNNLNITLEVIEQLNNELEYVKINYK